jgi:hypothetical protein
MVTSHKMIEREMEYRGSKSIIMFNEIIIVKEQRVDGSSEVCKVKSFFCKVYSSRWETSFEQNQVTQIKVSV